MDGALDPAGLRVSRSTTLMELASPSPCLNPPDASPRTAIADLDPGLRLAGTAALGSLAADDPRLAALRRACALLGHLEAERDALNRRLEESRRLDPMRQVAGRTSLDQAVEETRQLVRELDELLCAAAEGARTAARTHPKDHR